MRPRLVSLPSVIVPVFFSFPLASSVAELFVGPHDHMDLAWYKTGDEFLSRGATFLRGL